MPINAEFLTKTLSGEGEADAKVKAILAEFDADVNGLKLNRDVIKGEKDTALTKLKEFETKAAEYDRQIKELSDKVKSSGSEEAKLFYEAEKKRLTEEYELKVTNLSVERDTASKRITELMSVSEFEKALDGNTSIKPEVKGALRDLFYVRNQFDRKTIDGKEMFLSGENKTVKDTLAAYLGTPEGKYFVQETNSGGGAGGSHNANNSGAKTMKRADFEALDAAAKTKAVTVDKIAVVD